MTQFGREWRDVDPRKLGANLQVRLRAVCDVPPFRRGSKYGNQPHVVLPSLEVVPAGAADVPGAIRFDSKREADRFVALRRELEAGAIAQLSLQPPFALNAMTPEGVRIKVGTYIADFAYVRNGKLVVEDAKGVRTDLYRWKKSHAEAEHGIRIVEV
ncbi:MAG: DUF1064 domain-containing protein [Vicinamibacterales bacterium]